MDEELAFACADDIFERVTHHRAFTRMITYIVRMHATWINLATYFKLQYIHHLDGKA